MIYAVGAMLFLAGLLFIGYPLFKSGEAQDNGYQDRHRFASREAALRSLIEELELDFEMGVISEEDYRELDAKYRRELDDIHS